MLVSHCEIKTKNDRLENTLLKLFSCAKIHLLHACETTLTRVKPDRPVTQPHLLVLSHLNAAHVQHEAFWPRGGAVQHHR